MILTADSTVARDANRRKTGNGWHTTFIGKNRNTLKEGEAPPPPPQVRARAGLRSQPGRGRGSQAMEVESPIHIEDRAG